jgi:DNA invertase Pin-like site-specific DNA recombinase
MVRRWNDAKTFSWIEAPYTKWRTQKPNAAVNRPRQKFDLFFLAFAEFERSMIQERVRAGLKRAKAEGKQLGRPRIAPDLEQRIRAALNTPGRTEGVRNIAARFKVDPGTVQRISRPFDVNVSAVA